MGSLGPLVQLEERSAHNRVVPGSSPGRSIKERVIIWQENLQKLFTEAMNGKT